MPEDSSDPSLDVRNDENEAQSGDEPDADKLNRTRLFLSVIEQQAQWLSDDLTRPMERLGVPLPDPSELKRKA